MLELVIAITIVALIIILLIVSLIKTTQRRTKSRSPADPELPIIPPEPAPKPTPKPEPAPAPAPAPKPEPEPEPNSVVIPESTDGLCGAEHGTKCPFGSCCNNGVCNYGNGGMFTVCNGDPEYHGGFY